MVKLVSSNNRRKIVVSREGRIKRDIDSELRFIILVGTFYMKETTEAEVKHFKTVKSKRVLRIMRYKKEREGEIQNRIK